ncbi:MAG: PD-(D/E)XK nuclease family transposase, partial [Bacteroidales bacterium]|nr:PD-(D/E)XK nuclease family transposase [Bacteroidales bacterium]
MKKNTIVKNVEGPTGQQFAELLCDFMFKRVFGSEANKDLLISFLNVLLEDVEIEDVDFIPTEHLGLTEDDRKVIFDISCQCK